MLSIMKRILLLGVLIHVGAASAGIYKWVDRKGVTHYSESSPENTPTNEVEIEPPPPEATVRQSLDSLEESLKEQDRRTRAFEAEKKQLRAAQLAREKAREQKLESCSHALMQLRVLEDMVPVYLDEAGEYHTQTSTHSAGYSGKRVYLGDDERPMEIKRFKQEMKANCRTGTVESDSLRGDLIVNYHRSQCEKAKRLLLELERSQDKTFDADIRSLRGDVEKHCRYR
ncbi:MAG TPA: DUF4124 domain-containing protein [Gammaproteobacteria bacterium]|nr:DUF4124 domain-containing protein [Gammaproteobacteria bacterium]